MKVKIRPVLHRRSQGTFQLPPLPNPNACPCGGGRRSITKAQKPTKPSQAQMSRLVSPHSLERGRKFSGGPELSSPGFYPPFQRPDAGQFSSATKVPVIIFIFQILIWFPRGRYLQLCSPERHQNAFPVSFPRYTPKSAAVGSTGTGQGLRGGKGLLAFVP